MATGTADHRALALAFAASLPALAVLAAESGEVKLWNPAPVSSPLFESHPAFDPRTGDLYFVRSAPDFTGWRILVSRCEAGGRSAPTEPAFAGAGLEADPYFSPDGATLYFISTRASGAMRSQDLDLWRVDRGAGVHWGVPVRLPEPVNSAAAEWFPRISPDGWLYFGSSREGGLGSTDIWRARQAGDGRWTVENLGPAVNSAADEFESLLAPDGESMLLMTGEGYFESRRENGAWSTRVRLGPEINQNGTEVGALFSPSGRSLLFARDTKGPDSGELFLLRRGPPESWPPACPARRP